MSLTKLIPSLLVATLAIGVTTTPVEAQSAGAGANVVITDLDLEGVNIVDGVLTATGGTVSGTIAGLPFTTDVTNFALDLLPDGGTGACSVLDLELGPIDLDLLGAHVDTSAICLSITAMEGGGLLGDLLCDLAGGLNLGLLNLDDLTAGLSDILSGVLSESLAQADPAEDGAEDICDGECEVLDLAVGPVDLTLLGLNVLLDDCEGGPVQVCVSATQGQGLLGDLLCGLAGGNLLGGINLGLIEDLLGTILDALPTNGVNASAKQVGKLVKEAGRLLRDGELTNNELNRLTRRVEKLVRKS